MITIDIKVPAEVAQEVDRAVRARWRITQHDDGFGVEHETQGPVSACGVGFVEGAEAPARWETMSAAQAWLDALFAATEADPPWKYLVLPEEGDPGVT